MKKEQQTIEQKIAAALSDDISSEEVLKTIEQAEFAIETGDRKAAQDAADALKPESDVDQLDQAQRSWELRKKRLINLVQQLEEKYDEVRNRELLIKKLARYEAVKAEYDELDAELERLYPQLAGPLFELLSRCAQTNEACKQVGLLGFDDHLIRETKLFDLAGHLLWPPPQPNMAASLAMAMVPAYDPRYGPNWHQARAEDDKRAIELSKERERQEQERIVQEREAFYQRQVAGGR